MRSLYARFVLWLIRPALDRHNRIKVHLTAKPLLCDDGSQKRFFQAAIGRKDSPVWKTSSPNDDRRQK